jgi:hypothetical protein
MRIAVVAAFAVVLAACGTSDQMDKSSKPEEHIATLPPLLFQDCVSYATLDDSCTSAWYQCRLGSADPSKCVDAWEECCTLRGQGNRSRLATVEPVDR